MAFIVPKEMQHEYKMLVQRANRRIKSNLKYLSKHDITNEHTRRTMVASFDDPFKWASGRMPFSRSTKGRYVWNADTEQQEFREFKTENEFKQYLKHLSKWGEQTEKGELYATHPKQIKENYKSAIIRALNEVKDHYNISLPNGQIPNKVIKMLDDLSLEQITNFFANGDPSEDVEISQFNSDDFIDVTNAEEFTAVVESRINAIKRFH